MMVFGVVVSNVRCSEMVALLGSGRLNHATRLATFFSLRN